MKLRITVDGRTYEVEAEIIEQDQPYRGSLLPASQTHIAAPIAPAAPIAASHAAQPPAATGEAADESKAFRSPISGVVVRVSVQVGQTVQANEELMVVEAMKMETVLVSQGAGKITKVHASAGDSVQVTQTLIEFE